jgi:hypothetical protein
MQEETKNKNNKTYIIISLSILLLIFISGYLIANKITGWQTYNTVLANQGVELKFKYPSNFKTQKLSEDIFIESKKDSLSAISINFNQEPPIGVSAGATEYKNVGTKKFCDYEATAYKVTIKVVIIITNATPV